MRSLVEWIGAVIISLYPKMEVDGIRVIFTDTVVDRPECAARIRRAIEMAVAVGRPYAALMKRIRRVVIWPGNRIFADSAGGVHVSSEALLGIGDLALASVLVHESVHLRISALGVRYEPAHRERIERLCIGEQVRFLRSFGEQGEEMARDAELVLGFPWWTQEQRDADVEQLCDEHRIPKWVRSLVPRS